MADTTKVPPAPDPHAPLLDLSTLVERPQIKIDGTLHEILSPDELTVIQTQRFAAWGRRIDELTAKDELDPAERGLLSQIVRNLSDEIMVGVPQEVRAKLSDAMRLQVAEVFTLLPLRAKLKRLAGLKDLAGQAPAAGNRKARRASETQRRRAKQSTGANSQPDSSASTAATRAGG